MVTPIVGHRHSLLGRPLRAMRYRQYDGCQPAKQTQCPNHATRNSEFHGSPRVTRDCRSRPFVCGLVPTNLSQSTYLHDMAPPALKMPGVFYCQPVTLPRASWVPGNACLLSEARVASAAPAASFKQDYRKLAHH